MNGGIEMAPVIRATSDIGRAIAHALAEDGCALQFAARNPARLERDTGIREGTGGALTAHRCGTSSCRSSSDRSEALRLEDAQ